MDRMERVLNSIKGKEVDRPPAFSGMGTITIDNTEKFGYKFHEVLRDPEKMSDVAVASIELFELESVNIPIDQTIQAEAFGAEIEFKESDEKNIRYPSIKTNVVENIEDFIEIEPPTIDEAGKIPEVLEAIELAKEKAPTDIPIGGWVMGPYVSAGQLLDRKKILAATMRDPETVHEILEILKDFEINYINRLIEAGADFICLREPAASQDVLMPSQFEEIVKPYLTEILKNIDTPKILHICGLTDDIITKMWDCGPDALSVEEKNNLYQNRKDLGEKPVLYGAISPSETLYKGTPEDIKKAVQKSYDAGVNAAMPGDDIWPLTPKENMKAFVEETKKIKNKK
ncbi:uroporphyrinogen decarboxylase family protein [Methanonatronarchaeum sp. AMET-Sl]|uniref:uroporphyrinogen decarboxylase family protein n=1 Tax=Methanonatronarchaeum sp. AMET-Sl TaxID=3037654 RepID=UPI00244DD4DA|nr:uroporphyrinogen decarboxylase family protein [Methanonatronarchaeum sp. AMET-Sl]WGI17415.1 uroporphyrinogen decarboxylase family protein [Methanonatronarchaeum sp. AMET-Sl]